MPSPSRLGMRCEQEGELPRRRAISLPSRALIGVRMAIEVVQDLADGRVMEQAVRDGLIKVTATRRNDWQRHYQQVEDELNDPRTLALPDREAPRSSPRPHGDRTTQPCRSPRHHSPLQLGVGEAYIRLPDDQIRKLRTPRPPDPPTFEVSPAAWPRSSGTASIGTSTRPGQRYVSHLPLPISLGCDGGHDLTSEGGGKPHFKSSERWAESDCLIQSLRPVLPKAGFPPPSTGFPYSESQETHVYPL